MVVDRCSGDNSIFVEKHNILPLSGALPDLDTNNESYVILQRMYSQQASTCQGQCQKQGRIESNDNFKEATDTECKSAMSADETSLAPPCFSFFFYSFYVMLRATDMLHREHGRCAGKVKEMTDVDERLIRE